MKIINFLERGIVFESTIAKLLMNVDIVRSYMRELAQKDGHEWEEKTCLRCTPDNKCKKHKALEMLQTVDNCIEITNIGFEDLKLYVTKYAIFVPNPTAATLLAIDCPPITAPVEGRLSDVWVRRLTPFTFGNMEDFVIPRVSQVVDLNEIYQYPTVTMLVGKDRTHRLELHSRSSVAHHWVINKNEE
jgi:hypothetical protein